MYQCSKKLVTCKKYSCFDHSDFPVHSMFTCDVCWGSLGTSIFGNLSSAANNILDSDYLPDYFPFHMTMIVQTWGLQYKVILLWTVFSSPFHHKWMNPMATLLSTNVTWQTSNLFLYHNYNYTEFGKILKERTNQFRKTHRFPLI